jgi:glutaredoxin 3
MILRFVPHRDHQFRPAQPHDDGRDMTTIEIYTTPFCPYCWRAKRLLDRKGALYQEVDLYREPERRSEMLARAGGRRTVPQIFIDGRGIGGSDDLHALDARGELDPLLNGAAGNLPGDGATGTGPRT